jgi:hypothetical protein
MNKLSHAVSQAIKMFLRHPVPWSAVKELYKHALPRVRAAAPMVVGSTEDRRLLYLVFLAAPPTIAAALAVAAL